MGLIKSIIAAPHLERAQRQIIKGEYGKAINSISSVSKIVGSQFPSDSLPIRANIIVLQASYWLSDDYLSVLTARVIKKQLMDFSVRGLSADRMYTVEYVRGFVKFCSAKFPPHQEEFYSIFNELSSILEPFDMAKVSPHLKYEMPLGDDA